MKRAGHLFERVTDYENLLLAYSKALRGKRAKEEVKRFAEDVPGRIRRMKEELENGTFRVGRYRYFKIRDPKERVICAACFEERVFHHALMAVCHEVFERHLTGDTYATRRGMGGYAALDKALKGVTRYRQVAKLDFRKYFDSIRHETLKAQLGRLFKDGRVLDCLFRVIDSYEASPGRGIPIGNLTSQYMANHYLSGLDRKVREEWGVPLYVRYMDDMLLAADDRATLKRAVARLEAYADAELGLTLKPAQYARAETGVCFLGYRLRPHRLCLSSRAKRRFVRRWKDYERRYGEGEWTEADLRARESTIFSFIAHACYKGFYRDCVRKGRIEGLTA